MSQLFRHYKNKPYKYLGIVKHSETLEDLVLYETLYDNSIAKKWVRPKEMFFSNVQIGTESKPRFQRIDPTFKITHIITPEVLKDLKTLMDSIFEEVDIVKIENRIRQNSKFFLIQCFIEEKLIGFKLGYKINSSEFYSWLGGVDPNFRGLGLAQEMMKIQHNWCQSQGFQKISTKTKNRFKEMLILNLRSGFKIVGTQLEPNKELKIVLEKNLS